MLPDRFTPTRAAVKRPENEVSSTELAARAGEGDKTAWDALVDRYGNLVWSVARSFRLDNATAADVSQTTWLRLVENLDRIRDPERLAGWLATTARNEALRVVRRTQRELPAVDIEVLTDPVFVEPMAAILADERGAELLEVFNELSHDCQQLLRLATADPPLEYAEIADLLDRPIGSIGPSRARCLKQMRTRLEAISARTQGETR